MFSLRANSSKMSRKMMKTEVNSGNKSFDSIDKIDEETASRKQSADVSQEMKFITAKISSYTRESSASDKSSETETNDISVYLEPDIKYPLRTSTPVKRVFNPFQETNEQQTNGFHETHFDINLNIEQKKEGLKISKDIIDEVLSELTDAAKPAPSNEDIDNDYVRYDDRKNPFMDEVYDDSLVFA